MKELYFTQETIRERSQQMLQRLKRYRDAHDIKFAPKRCALLILDMQRFFFDESSHAYIPSALSIIPKIKDLFDAFLKRGLQVILTRHLNSREDAKLMSKWWRDLITETDPLSEIIPEMNLPGATVIKKTQYDAFYQTPLEDLLKKSRITQLVISGVMTHLCCETTARTAFVRGFTVFFPIDGTATYTEAHHWATLLNLSHGFAVPVLMKELQGCLKEPRARSGSGLRSGL